MSNAASGFREPDAGDPVEETLRAQSLVEEKRARVRSGLTGGRDGLSALVIGGGFVVLAVVLALRGSHEGLEAVTLTAGVLLYAAAFRVEFEVGPGSAVPTELVLVPMLFTLPLAIVPGAVAAGMLLGFLVGRVHPVSHPHRILAQLTSAWHAIGPVLVFELAGSRKLDLGHAPILALALAAQFVFDLLSTVARNRVGLGVPIRALLDALRWTFLVDLLLAPIAVTAVIAADASGWAFLAVVPVLALIAVHAHDRRRQLDRSIALGRAYNAASDRARRDPLTGLGNRLAWEEALAGIELAGEGRVGVVLIDLNRLKEANDTRGHAFGDAVIVELGQLLSAHMVFAATVARLGGDEFGALFIGETAERSEEAATALRRAIDVRPALDGFRLSAAVGSASCPPCATVGDAFRTADERVYDEKRRGPRARDAA